MKALLEKICQQIIPLLLEKIHQKRFWLFITGVGVMTVLFIVIGQHTTDLFFGIIYAFFLFIVGLCFIGSLVLLIPLVIKMMIIFKIKSRLLELSLYGIVGSGFILMTEFTIGSLIWKKNIDESEENAYIIIKALEKYKNEKGKYPEKLEELVPQYLTEIPKAKTKYPFFKDCEFSYSREENYYRLSFLIYGDRAYIYQSDTREWLLKEF